MKYRLIARWDDGCPAEVIGDFDKREDAENVEKNHEYMCNPFMREHVEFTIEEVNV